MTKKLGRSRAHAVSAALSPGGDPRVGDAQSTDTAKSAGAGEIAKLRIGGFATR